MYVEAKEFKESSIQCDSTLLAISSDFPLYLCLSL